MKKISILFLLTIFAFSKNYAYTNFILKSPDNRISVEININDRIFYSVSFDNKLLMYYSPLSLDVRGKGILGKNPVLINKTENHVNESISTIWGNRKSIINNYNEIILSFKYNYNVVFRTYNDGIAYRFETKFKENIIINNEEVSYRFLENYKMWCTEYGFMNNSFEALYTQKTLKELKSDKYSYTPVVIEIPDGKRIVLCEADLLDYPGMFLQHPDNITRYELAGLFSPVPLAFTDGGYNKFDEYVTKSADYIAQTKGSRSFPWRAMIITDNDADILNSDMVYKLSKPLELNDVSWIKPGLVSWDWWNDWNLENVNFKTGINTQTYKYYIDFASRYKLPYVILDEGWSDPFNLFLLKPEMDVQEIIRYAESKNVKIVLWCLWKTLNLQMKEALPLFQKWGAAGLKIDFIDRDDQLVISSLENIARETAKYKLIVDFHGCSKPTGLSRAYPNVLNYEGVRGNEYNKFSTEPPMPDYDAILPFTRLVAGPMDFTPGAMRNFAKGEYYSNYSNPGSNGTRCHQLGMYVVYSAPFQMLCDAPTQYEKYPEILDILSSMPVTWDETVPVDAAISKYAVVARKSGNSWYIGGINGWVQFDVIINFKFLNEGKYDCEIIKDGINANRIATDYIIEKTEVDRNTNLKLTMANGGGFLINLTPKQDVYKQ